LVVTLYTDIKWNKIYNSHTVPFALLGLCLMTASGATGEPTLFGEFDGRPVAGAFAGLGASIIGIILGVAAWFLCNIIGRILGAGDSKLLACLGALMGPQFLIYTLISTAIIGGVLAIVIALWRGYLKKSLATLVSSLYSRIFHKQAIDIENSAPQARLPYAIPISLGALATLYYIHVWLR
jgi:prepilin peptidase CpaA